MPGSGCGAGSQQRCRLALCPPSPAPPRPTRQSSPLPAGLSIFLGEEVPLKGCRNVPFGSKKHLMFLLSLWVRKGPRGQTDQGRTAEGFGMGGKGK